MTQGLQSNRVTTSKQIAELPRGEPLGSSAFFILSRFAVFTVQQSFPRASDEVEVPEVSLTKLHGDEFILVELGAEGAVGYFRRRQRKLKQKLLKRTCPEIFWYNGLSICVV